MKVHNTNQQQQLISLLEIIFLLQLFAIVSSSRPSSSRSYVFGMYSRTEKLTNDDMIMAFCSPTTFLIRRSYNQWKNIQTSAFADTSIHFSSSSSRSCSSYGDHEQLPTTSLSVENEKEAVKRQLGYLPTNFICVSAWKQQQHQQRQPTNGKNSSNRNILVEPIAIQTYPLKLRKTNTKQQQSNIISTPTPTPTTTTNTKDNIQNPYDVFLSEYIPFPTLYWLTCPKIIHAISELERVGYITKFQKQLETLHPKLIHEYKLCHTTYAKLRWNSLHLQHQKLLNLVEDIDNNNNNNNISSSSSSEGSSSSSLFPSIDRIRIMLQYSGIAGTNIYTTNDNYDITSTNTIPFIKCLHAHYAHYRSTIQQQLIFNKDKHINPVGQMIHEQLQADFPELDL